MEPVNTADVFGATVPQTQAGNSYSLDVTTDSAVTLGDNYRIGTGDFTFEAYVKVTGGAGSWQQMASKMTASTNTASWALLLDKSGQPMFQVRGSSASESAAATGSTSLIDSQWHHLAAVVDRTAGNIRLYVDGDLAATGAPNWAGFATEDFNGTQTASIGARNGSDSYMTGYVDEVRFSNEALDTSQFLNAIPEPGTVVLLTAGGAIAMLRRRRHQ